MRTSWRRWTDNDGSESAVGCERGEREEKEKRLRGATAGTMGDDPTATEDEAQRWRSATSTTRVRETTQQRKTAQRKGMEEVEGRREQQKVWEGQ